MMQQYETVHKGDIYIAQIVNAPFGGCNLTVQKVRHGRTPKSFFAKHCQSSFDAKMAMEKCLPDATWKEKEI